MTRPIMTGDTDNLARELYEARRDLRSAGRGLHDQVGPLLAAAGIRLQLVCMDFPESRDAVMQAVHTLDQAMDQVRALSQRLNASPAARVGLERALIQRIAQLGSRFSGTIRLVYAAAPPSLEATVAVYDAVGAALEWAAADRSASRIRVSVKGRRGVHARLESNGRARWPRRDVAALARRLRPAGIVLDVVTKEGTIVSIRYAHRSPARG